MSFASLIELTGFCLACAGWVVFFANWSRPPNGVYGLFALSATAFFIYDALTGSPIWATFQGAAAVLHAWLWWRGRRKGRMKKALKELGAKSRARIEALVERLSPSPIPAPGGAR